MKCSRCGSERIFKFERSSRIRSDVEVTLPAACCDCGQVTVGGIQLPMPAELAAATKKLAIAAEEKGTEVSKEIMAEDPEEVRVAKYFGRVYESGYLDGFIRALAFFQHRHKQGRMFRLRALWNECEFSDQRSVHHEFLRAGDYFHNSEPIQIAGPSVITMRMAKAVYTEFVRLLEPTLDAAGDRHGQSSENQYPTSPKSPSPVP